MGRGQNSKHAQENNSSTVERGVPARAETAEEQRPSCVGPLPKYGQIWKSRLY